METHGLPCIEEKMVDGKYKYFFYFIGNPMWPEAANRWGGGSRFTHWSFKTWGHPITESPVGHGQQIDVDVFTDPVSGKSYLYWGNGYIAGAELE